MIIQLTQDPNLMEHYLFMIQVQLTTMEFQFKYGSSYTTYRSLYMLQ